MISMTENDYKMFDAQSKLVVSTVYIYLVGDNMMESTLQTCSKMQTSFVKWCRTNH